MKKRILLISSSPNKEGNSSTLLQSFAQGIERSGGEIIAKVDLYDLPLAPYSHSVKRPLESETEFAKIAEMFSDIDAVVIATPTYNFSVPGVLKNFLDRLSYKALDYSKKNRVGQPVGRFSHLHCFFIVTGGTPVWVQKMLFVLFPVFYLRVVFAYFGCFRSSGAYVGEVSHSNHVSSQEKTLLRFQQYGEQFARK